MRTSRVKVLVQVDFENSAGGGGTSTLWPTCVPHKTYAQSTHAFYMCVCACLEGAIHTCVYIYTHSTGNVKQSALLGK